ncbi:MAG: putative pre-16S rRNA nuclease [Phycisphaerae bacterium]|nr:putative pre-16S rRNA nuclease [Phycisphaerae bacterium]
MSFRPRRRRFEPPTFRRPLLPATPNQYDRRPVCKRPTSPTGRWLAVDYGRRRIGLAICDQSERFSSPLAVIASTQSLPDDAQVILRHAVENDAVGVVIGLPLNMDGTDSEQTRLVRKFASQVAAIGSLPVEFVDERLSTYAADDLMRDARIPRARRSSLRDALAAQIILQAFLDTRQRPAE